VCVGPSYSTRLETSPRPQHHGNYVPTQHMPSELYSAFMRGIILPGPWGLLIYRRIRHLPIMGYF